MDAIKEKSVLHTKQGLSETSLQLMAACLSTHTRRQLPLRRGRGCVSQIVHLRAQKHSGSALPPSPAFLFFCCFHTHSLSLNLSHTFTRRFITFPSLSLSLFVAASLLSLSLCRRPLSFLSLSLSLSPSVCPDIGGHLQSKLSPQSLRLPIPHRGEYLTQ